MTTVIPSLVAMSWTSCMMECCIFTSKLATGSSARMIFGSWISMRGDSDALLLPAAQRVSAAVVKLRIVEPRPPQGVNGGLVILMRKGVGQGAEEAQVVQPPAHDVDQHGHPVDEIELLENHADVRAKRQQFLVGHVADLLAVDDDVARGRLHQVVEAPEQGRLTDAAGPGRGR